MHTNKNAEKARECVRVREIERDRERERQKESERDRNEKNRYPKIERDNKGTINTN